MSNSYGFGRQGQDPGHRSEAQESYQNHRQEGHQVPGTWSSKDGSFSYGDINYGPSGRNLNGLPINIHPHNPIAISKASNQANMQSFGQRLNSVGRGRSLAINTPNLHQNNFKDKNQTPTFASFSPTRITSPDDSKLILDNETNIWSDPVTRRNSDEYVNSFQFNNNGLNNEFYKNASFTAQPSPLPFYGSSDLQSPIGEMFDSFPRKASAPSTTFRPMGASQPFDPISHKGDFNFGSQFLEDPNASRQYGSRLPVHSKEYLDYYADCDKIPIMVNRDNRNQFSVTSAMDLSQLKISSPELDSYSFNNPNKPSMTSRHQNSSQNFDYQYNDSERNEIQRHQNHHPSQGKNNNPIQVPPAAGLCRFFLQGFCTKANRCKFRHVSKDEYQRVMSQFKEPISNINRPRNFQTQRHNPLIQGKPKAVPFSQPANNYIQRYSQPLSPTSISPVHMQVDYQSFEETHTPKIEKASKVTDEPNFGTQLDLRFLSEDFVSSLNDIASLCSDQNGCRFLQKKLEEKIPYQTQIIFQEVSKIFVNLMTDPFGNYLCQKLMEYCSASQLIYLALLSSPFLLQVALNSHGTRTLQKMLDFSYSSLDEAPTAIVILTQSLQNHVIELIKDLSGNHVIQKCLIVLPPELNQFIFDSISSNVMDVATHRHGCCVIQRCMENASEHQQRQLALAIIEASSILVQDPFGNYVIQAVLDLGIPEFVSLLFKNFKNRICTLSVQKYSSNVIEKCIRLAPSSTRCHLIQELLTLDRFDLLIRDSYANYVVQTCLEVAEPDQRVQLVRSIEPFLNSVKDTAYGKRILDCISRFDNNSLEPKESRSQSTNFNSPPFTNNFPGGSSQSRQEDHPSPILA